MEPSCVTCYLVNVIKTYGKSIGPITLVTMKGHSRSLRFRRLTLRRGAEAICYLYKLIGNDIWWVHWHSYIWPWVTLKDLFSRTLSLWRLVSRSGAYLGHTILLNTNRKIIYRDSSYSIIFTHGRHWKFKVGHLYFKLKYLIKEPN